MKYSTIDQTAQTVFTVNFAEDTECELLLSDGTQHKTLPDITFNTGDVSVVLGIDVSTFGSQTTATGTTPYSPNYQSSITNTLTTYSSPIAIIKYKKTGTTILPQYVLNFAEDIQCEILLVGGGGGGGTNGGGGGGGDVISHSVVNFLTGVDYIITVGKGGLGGRRVDGNQGAGFSGNTSSVSGGIVDLKSGGGGGGGGYNNSAFDGVLVTYIHPVTGVSTSTSGGGGGEILADIQRSGNGVSGNGGRNESNSTSGGGGGGSSGAYNGGTYGENGGDAELKGGLNASFGGNGGKGNTASMKGYEIQYGGGGGGCSVMSSQQSGTGFYNGGQGLRSNNNHLLTKHGSNGGGGGGVGLNSEDTVSAGNGGDGIFIIKYKSKTLSANPSDHRITSEDEDDVIIELSEGMYHTYIPNQSPFNETDFIYDILYVNNSHYSTYSSSSIIFEKIYTFIVSDTPFILSTSAITYDTLIVDGTTTVWGQALATNTPKIYIKYERRRNIVTTERLTSGCLEYSSTGWVVNNTLKNRIDILETQIASLIASIPSVIPSFKLLTTNFYWSDSSKTHYELITRNQIVTAFSGDFTIKLFHTNLEKTANLQAQYSITVTYDGVSTPVTTTNGTEDIVIYTIPHASIVDDTIENIEGYRQGKEVNITISDNTGYITEAFNFRLRNDTAATPYAFTAPPQPDEDSDSEVMDTAAEIAIKILMDDVEIAASLIAGIKNEDLQTPWRVVRKLESGQDGWYFYFDNLDGDVASGTRVFNSEYWTTEFGDFTEFLFTNKTMTRWLQMKKTSLAQGAQEVMGSEYNLTPYNIDIDLSTDTTWFKPVLYTNPSAIDASTIYKEGGYIPAAGDITSKHGEGFFVFVR